MTHPFGVPHHNDSIRYRFFNTKGRPVGVFSGGGDLRDENGGASQSRQFLSKREQEIADELFGFDLVTQRGDRVDDKASHTDGVDDVYNCFNQSMYVIKFERGFVKTEPGIQYVHVEYVDEPRIDHVHVKKCILANVFQKFYRRFGCSKVGTRLTCESTTNKELHAERRFSRTACSSSKNCGAVGNASTKNLIQSVDTGYAPVSGVNGCRLHGNEPLVQPVVDEVCAIMHPKRHLIRESISLHQAWEFQQYSRHSKRSCWCHPTEAIGL